MMLHLGSLFHEHATSQLREVGIRHSFLFIGTTLLNIQSALRQRKFSYVSGSLVFRVSFQKVQVIQSTLNQGLGPDAFYCLL